MRAHIARHVRPLPLVLTHRERYRLGRSGSSGEFPRGPQGSSGSRQGIALFLLAAVERKLTQIQSTTDPAGALSRIVRRRAAPPRAARGVSTLPPRELRGGGGRWNGFGGGSRG